MNAISTLTLLPRTRTEIAGYVEQVKKDILSGYVAPEWSAIMLKSFEEIIKSLRSDKDIKEHIQNAADMYSENIIEYDGAKIAKSNRATYDFTACNDPVWVQDMKELEQLKAKIKGREGWLKTLRETDYDRETGVKIDPPVKRTSEIITVTLKR